MRAHLFPVTVIWLGSVGDHCLFDCKILLWCIYRVCRCLINKNRIKWTVWMFTLQTVRKSFKDAVQNESASNVNTWHPAPKHVHQRAIIHFGQGTAVAKITHVVFLLWKYIIQKPRKKIILLGSSNLVDSKLVVISL